DSSSLKTKPRITHGERQLRGLWYQRGRLLNDRTKRGQQSGRRARIQQRCDIRPMRRQDIERQVDAVEIAIILGAVLHMIEDLERRTERIGIGPRRAVLAVHIEHKAPDRHGGIAAIMHELIPIRVAALGDVGAKSGEEIERMNRSKPLLRQYLSQQNGGLGAI